ncbi:hypothetical protein R1sor_007818 [Riccia sorocarpa]|uniref:Uncharacterized protein n=1 Tax=Riccia sorocarpa TaxID=122646 RepID=A0ABD3HV21_9MARC
MAQSPFMFMISSEEISTNVEDILELEFQGKKKSFKMLQVSVLVAVNPAERMDHESMGWDILLTRTSLKLQKLFTLELIKEVVATRINIITEAITITMMVVQLVWPITFEMVSSRPVSKIVSVVVAAEKGSGEHQQQVGSRSQEWKVYSGVQESFEIPT